MKDFDLSTNGVFINDEVGLVIQQIDLLFDTQEKEVFGEEYGSNFYDFLWDLSVTNGEISEYTKELICSNVKLFGWSVNVSTDLLQGTQNDIIIIHILLSKENYSFEKTYKIE